MGVRDDILFLERQAQFADTDARAEDAQWLRDIGKRIKVPPVEIVEQTVLTRKTGTIPGGGTWSDIPPLRGYLSGVFLQPGNTVIEQRGHFLYVVQAETGFEGRQNPIYEALSSLKRENESKKGTPGLRSCFAVLVVFGYVGLREGVLWFKEGKQLPAAAIYSGADLGDQIYDHLMACVHNPILDDDRDYRKKPKPPQLPGLDV